jgi:hypothetical protein
MTSTEELQELLNHTFELAYAVSDRTNIEDYAEEARAALEEEARDRMDLFRSAILGERAHRHRQLGESVMLHSAHLDAECRYFEQEDLAFTIVSLEGTDTYGYPMAADQLQVQRAEVLDDDSSILIYLRRGQTHDTLRTRAATIIPGLLVPLCAQLEKANEISP